MASKKSARFFGILLLLALPPILLLVMGQIRRRENLRTYQESIQHFEDVKQRLAAMEFAPVTDAPEFAATITNLQVVELAQLSEEQSTALKSSLYDMVMAFHVGTYDAYRHFRTPIKAEFNPQAIDYHVYVLTNFYLHGKPPPSDPEAITQLLWEQNYGGNAFKDYWKGLCLTNVLITAEKTNAMPPDLFHYAQARDNRGTREIIPTFQFQPSPSQLLKQTRSLLYATMILNVKPAEPDPVFPVFVRYYWEDQSKKWLPWEMTSGNAQKRVRDPMF